MATDKTKRLNVADMDFASIKSSLIAALSEDDVLKDTNFEGSAANTLLDALVYITHFNAVNANMALNETFLDSAQLRQSVVSHAKLLGYIPRSAYSPVAYVDVLINNPTSVTNSDGDYIPMVMNRGTQFNTLISGKTYTFVNDSTHTIVRNSLGQYKFTNIKLVQGSYKNISYVFDKDTAEKFVIPQENVVTSSLNVSVREAAGSSEIVDYELAGDITDIDSNSNVYFIQEGMDGLFEIYFGDGVLGNKPNNGNIVELEYIVTDAEAANGASTFSLVDNIQNNSDATITTLTTASGGAEKEDIDSIKFNAPLGFVSQNRAVTPDDYKAIVLNAFPNIDAISVWGGEDNDPPDYGKVYISIKPRDAEVLTELQKAQLISQDLKPKNVVSITPTIVDPTYTYIYLEVFFKYNPNLTDASGDDLAIIAREAIRDYNDNELKRFDGVFRHSNMQSVVDNSDPAIINSTIRVKMKKRFVPTLNTEKKYTIKFSSALYTTSSDEKIIETTAFTYLNRSCTLRDRKNDDGSRRIQIVTGSGANEAILDADAGTVDEANGTIELTAFNPSAFVGDYIEITASPESNDLAPKRNELLNILVDDSTVSGEVDTMITGGTSAGVDYTTTSRH
jgi:hypothetical protein